MNVKHYRPHILVVIALAVVLASGWHDAFRNALADLRFEALPREAGGDVVIVAIDTPSIEKIGVWPWPRRLHAELLRQMEKAGVRDIAFDVDFSAPSDPASDHEFVEALRGAAGSVILPSFQQSAADPANPGALHINRPLKPFADQSWAALVNIAIERDGRVRRYPFGDRLGAEYLPSMAAMLAGQFSNKSAPFLIDYGIRAGSVPSVSFIDVLRGDVATLAKLRDKKVIVGGTALELGDRFSVPNGRILSGPLLQTVAAESMLQNRTLRWTSDLVTLTEIAAISLLMMFAWRRFKPGVRVMMLLGTVFAVEIAALLLQAKWPLILDTSLLDTAIVAYLAAMALDEIDFRGLLGRIAERRFHRIAMSLGDGLACTDQDHRIIFWNPGAEAIFGYSAAEIIGKPIDLICANEGRAPFLITEAARPAWFTPGGSVTEFEARRRDGETFPVEACFSAWHGADGVQHGAILRDITARKREAERIRYLAEYDSLTGLANRNTLQSGLAAMIASTEKSASGADLTFATLPATESQANVKAPPESKFASGPLSPTFAKMPAATECECRNRTTGGIALLVLGLDGFMNINDLLGHAAGDRVLRAVARRLTEEAGRDGLVARLSGDEFAIAMPLESLPYPVSEFAERIVEAFEQPLLAGSREHRIKISTGVAIYPENGRNADELLSNGHLAFCRAKGPRRGGHVMFDNSMRQELEARVMLEAELALAVERGEFELFYQPQVHLADGRLSGAEALIRWRHPERGLVAPMQFMPVVNSSAISEKIAVWVMETACLQAVQWELAGHGVRVGINLSPSQLQSGDLAKAVADMLDATGLSPGLLELEVTEDILLQDEARVLDTFQRIQQLGVRVVFDDFGTGYASLSYLKKFPLDGLKIDKSFVFELLTDSDDAAIVNSTVGLSKQLGLSVIAEGIENRASADLLLTMGCEQGQGYFFGKPMPAREFEAKWFARAEAMAG
jgi:diguanylate cyclase (GGDEF)-like protein/PAS domain S-box-containing protein